MSKTKKGFTILELLIVIGILAILSSVAVLVLNPAELLRQARDAQRINDLAAINNAIALYVSTASTIALGTDGLAYVHNTGTNDSPFGGACGSTGTPGTETKSANRTTGGSGWIPVNFDGIPGGSPLSVLPIDPTNVGTTTSTQLLYWYKKSGTTAWELNMRTESARYSAGGANDVVGTDGGNCTDYYEIGTDPGLDL